MKFKKILLALITAISAFLMFSVNVFADTDVYSLLDSHSADILRQLDFVTEVNEQGLPIVNTDVAYEMGLDEEAMEVAYHLNQIVKDIETNGESSALAAMERALFPIGAYGNYCGKGNNGWNVAPIDDLDSACREHDKCFKGFTKDNRSCNKAFLTRLAPIIQKNSALTTKGAYALAAFKLFSNFI